MHYGYAQIGNRFMLGDYVGAVTLFEFTLNQSFIGSDDAYIPLRYIDNLRSGHGFGFNPNKPSNGSTSPLWVNRRQGPGIAQKPIYKNGAHPGYFAYLTNIEANIIMFTSRPDRGRKR